MVASHVCPPLETWLATLACALDWESIGDPLVHRLVLNPLRHITQGFGTPRSKLPSQGITVFSHSEVQGPTPDFALPNTLDLSKACLYTTVNHFRAHQASFLFSVCNLWTTQSLLALLTGLGPHFSICTVFLTGNSSGSQYAT